jgi:hypothetical protein
MDLWHRQRTQFTLICPFFCSTVCAWVRMTHEMRNEVTRV